MKIINANVEFITPVDGAAILKRLEQCGRVCYKSEAKITDTSAYEGLKPIIREDEEQQRRLNNLIFVLKYIIRLAGFELLNRIELKDKRNGREYR
jgi:hypothetical protein